MNKMFLEELLQLSDSTEEYRSAVRNFICSEFLDEWGDKDDMLFDEAYILALHTNAYGLYATASVDGLEDVRVYYNGDGIWTAHFGRRGKIKGSVSEIIAVADIVIEEEREIYEGKSGQGMLSLGGHDDGE